MQYQFISEEYINRTIVDICDNYIALVVIGREIILYLLDRNNKVVKWERRKKFPMSAHIKHMLFSNDGSLLFFALNKGITTYRIYDIKRRKWVTYDGLSHTKGVSRFGKDSFLISYELYDNVPYCAEDLATIDKNGNLEHNVFSNIGHSQFIAYFNLNDQDGILANQNYAFAKVFLRKNDIVIEKKSNASNLVYYLDFTSTGLLLSIFRRNNLCVINVHTVIKHEDLINPILREEYIINSTFLKETGHNVKFNRNSDEIIISSNHAGKAVNVRVIQSTIKSKIAFLALFIKN